MHMIIANRHDENTNDATLNFNEQSLIRVNNLGYKPMF